MNALLTEIKRSLVELDLGLSGDLTMTAPMEALMMALAENRVPTSWAAEAYPSLRQLNPWIQNLLQRVQQLSDWTSDLQVPKSVWLSGLFNPQSFLTAVMQVGELICHDRRTPTQLGPHNLANFSCLPVVTSRNNRSTCPTSFVSREYALFVELR